MCSRDSDRSAIAGMSASGVKEVTPLICHPGKCAALIRDPVFSRSRLSAALRPGRQTGCCALLMPAPNPERTLSISRLPRPRSGLRIHLLNSLYAHRLRDGPSDSLRLSRGTHVERNTAPPLIPRLIVRFELISSVRVGFQPSK